MTLPVTWESAFAVIDSNPIRQKVAAMSSIRMMLNPDEQCLLQRVLKSALDEAQKELRRTSISQSFRDNRISEARIFEAVAGASAACVDPE